MNDLVTWAATSKCGTEATLSWFVDRDWWTPIFRARGGSVLYRSILFGGWLCADPYRSTDDAVRRGLVETRLLNEFRGESV